ncbi:hypothetical protein EPO44_10340 [bacterium]|nr:MAG: hypothetical protein EPO44_10340 [bacterium]
MAAALFKDRKAAGAFAKRMKAYPGVKATVKKRKTKGRGLAYSVSLRRNSDREYCDRCGEPLEESQIGLCDDCQKQKRRRKKKKTNPRVTPESRKGGTRGKGSIPAGKVGKWYVAEKFRVIRRGGRLIIEARRKKR